MSKRKIIAPLISLLLICAVITPVLAYSSFPLTTDDQEIQDALGYLRSIQAADGSIGSYSDSAWAVMAIAAAGEDPKDWGFPSVVDYLKGNADLLSGEFNMGTAYGRVILAILASGKDPSTFGIGDPTYAPSGDYISQLRDLHDGTQFTDGFGNTDMLNDDFWGIMALVAADESQDTSLITASVAFVKDNQAEDGGWSWATVDNPWYTGSDVDSTAAAIMALIAAGEHPQSTLIGDALGYLKDNQNISGGFVSWGAVSLASTIQAVDAIVAARQDPTSDDWKPGADTPIDFILSMQETEGSFFDPGSWSPMREKNTSEAIIALMGKHYPVKYTPTYIYGVGGEAYPVSRSAILIPWLVLGIAAIAVIIIASRRYITHRKI